MTVTFRSFTPTLFGLSERRTVGAARRSRARRRGAPRLRPRTIAGQGSHSAPRRLSWRGELAAPRQAALTRGARGPTFRPKTWLHRAQGLELVRGQRPFEDLSCALTQETGDGACIGAGQSQRRRHDRRRECRGIVAVGKDELVRVCADPEADAATSPAVGILDGENGRELPGG